VKDLFSTQSSEYAKFRPAYPPALASDIASLCTTHQLAWDAGTGNGQFAVMLSKYFERVVGTDISEKQLANATRKANIEYEINDSTATHFFDHSVDLVTVAQAVHWFDFEKFYAEVKRVLKKDGIIALVGYGLLRSDPKVNEVIADFYNNTLKGFWDAERRHVDEEYKNIPFPFQEIQLREHVMPYTWNIDQLMGYLSTWSALQHCMKTTNSDPLPLLKQRLLGTGLTEFPIAFPIFSRVGRP
jgi:SAM-dependent methyltransferase